MFTIWIYHLYNLVMFTICSCYLCNLVYHFRFAVISPKKKCTSTFKCQSSTNKIIIVHADILVSYGAMSSAGSVLRTWLFWLDNNFHFCRCFISADSIFKYVFVDWTLFKLVDGILRDINEQENFTQSLSTWNMILFEEMSTQRSGYVCRFKNVLLLSWIARV